MKIVLPKSKSLVYKCSDLINKKKILEHLDFIMKDNAIANPIYSPAILCSTHDNLKDTDTSLLLRVELSPHCSLLDTEADKFEDFLVGMGNIIYNDTYCTILRSKKHKIDSAKKNNDWNWFLKNEDLLEEISDDIGDSYSYLLPAIYKSFTKRNFNIIKAGNTYLLLQPTIVISKVESF